MENRKVDGKYLNFTIIELVFVLTIIVVIAVVTLPYFSQVKLASSRSTCEYNLLAIGMALATYSDDFDLYPVTQNLIEYLHQANYLKSGLKLRCPLDKSTIGNTYSFGYMGGHPATMHLEDPLVVCGHHPQIGTLAVFPDTSVGILSEKHQDSSDIVPITITQGGKDVEPGFLLHESDALVIQSEDGNEASIYGEGGAYFISASYDPSANQGSGMFTVTIGFDDGLLASGSAWEESENYVKFQTTLRWTKVELTSNPADSDSTRLEYANDQPLITTNHLGLIDYYGYRVTHLVTGQHEETQLPAPITEYNTSAVSMTKSN